MDRIQEISKDHYIVSDPNLGFCIVDSKTNSVVKDYPNCIYIDFQQNIINYQKQDQKEKTTETILPETLPKGSIQLILHSKETLRWSSILENIKKEKHLNETKLTINPIFSVSSNDTLSLKTNKERFIIGVQYKCDIESTNNLCSFLDTAINQLKNMINDKSLQSKQHFIRCLSLEHAILYSILSNTLYHPSQFIQQNTQQNGNNTNNIVTFSQIQLENFEKYISSLKELLPDLKGLAQSNNKKNDSAISTYDGFAEAMLLAACSNPKIPTSFIIETLLLASSGYFNYAILERFILFSLRPEVANVVLSFKKYNSDILLKLFVRVIALIAELDMDNLSNVRKNLEFFTKKIDAKNDADISESAKKFIEEPTTMPLLALRSDKESKFIIRYEVSRITKLYQKNKSLSEVEKGFIERNLLLNSVNPIGIASMKAYRTVLSCYPQKINESCGSSSSNAVENLFFWCSAILTAQMKNACTSQKWIKVCIILKKFVENRVKSANLSVTNSSIVNILEKIVKIDKTPIVSSKVKSYEQYVVYID